MATKAQKEELIEILKFTPRTYSIYIGGYGGESYAGKVSKNIYDFFKEKKIDLDEYATDWGDMFADVPPDMQPFSPGSPYDCDNLFHASGAELSNLNEIQVNDENGDEHWVCAAGLNELEDAGVTVNELGGCDFEDLPSDTVVYWGGQGEKGTFFDGEVFLKEPFDPKKLTIGYENCDGWWIINCVEYDGEEIDGSSAYSTTGKWGENKWILCNGDDVYESQPRNDENEDDEYRELDTESDEDTVSDEIDFQMTEWYAEDVKPIRKGEYEVDLGKDVAWPFLRIIRAEWTGRSWKDNGNKIKIVAWRGLATEPAQQ
jgi:hypothetical protein